MPTVWNPSGVTRPAFDGLTSELWRYSTKVRGIAPGDVEGADMAYVYDVAQRNTDREPVNTDTASPDMIELSGTSPFIAAKTLNMPELIKTAFDTAPLGVLFGVPHRSRVYLHRVGKSTVDAMQILPVLILTNAREEPDSWVSQHTYYWNGVTHRVTSFGPNGPKVTVDGAFADALKRA